MTASRSYAKNSDESLLDDLTSLMSIANGIGTEADSEHTSATRVVWIPEEWSTGKVRVQPTDGHAIGEHGRAYQVALYAGSYTALQELYHALRRALDTRLTLEAFEVGKGKPKGGSGGWGILVPVTLKGPIYAEVYGSALLETTTQIVDVTGELDTSSATVLS